MKKVITLLFVCILLAGAGWAQKDRKQKPWTEWSRREAVKMLTDSPWSRTQTIADASALFSGGGASGGGNSRRGSRVSVDQSVPLDFYICLLSAKPVRQAWARKIELEQNPTEEFRAQLLKFVETPSEEWITISVTFSSTDEQIRSMAGGILNSVRSERIKDDTYLEVKNGKRVALEEYGSPQRDFVGARFRFGRMVDGRPLITQQSGDLHFHSRLTQSLVLDARFKVSDLLYEGALTY